MPEAAERLSRLEQYVQRAIELIECFRAENGRLRQERVSLTERVDVLTKEVAGLRQREQSVLRLEVEHRRLVEERGVLLGQVEGVLKELARLEGASKGRGHD